VLRDCCRVLSDKFDFHRSDGCTDCQPPRLGEIKKFSSTKAATITDFPIPGSSVIKSAGGLSCCAIRPDLERAIAGR
jgi:hypothetical protein